MLSFKVESSFGNLILVVFDLWFIQITGCTSKAEFEIVLYMV